jgi:hypothetical protein
MAAVHACSAYSGVKIVLLVALVIQSEVEESLGVKNTRDVSTQLNMRGKFGRRK